MNPFMNILVILDTVAKMATLIPQAAVPAAWADSLLQIAIQTNAAHQQLFGKPLDYSLLRPYTPVPLDTTGTAPPATNVTTG